MKKKTFLVCALSLLASAGAWSQTVALAPVNRAVAVTWAADLHHFFASPQPDLSMIQGVADGLARLKADDAKTLKSLAPVIDQLRREAAVLLRPSLPAGVDPGLAAQVVKLRLLAAPAFNSRLEYDQRMRAEPKLEEYRRRLDEQQRAKVEAKLAEIGQALGGGSSWPTALSTEGPQTEKARAYLREKGILADSIRYSEGYEVPGLGMYDGPSWQPDSLTVGFADAAAYRRWKDALPKKIDGISVYPDGNQFDAVGHYARVSAEEEQLAKARDRFAASGIPVSQVALAGYDGTDIVATFPDDASAVKWHGALPKKIGDASVLVDAKHDAALKNDLLARQEQAVRAYFEQRGVAVLAIEHQDAYYDPGMNWDLPGDGAVPERLVVTLSSAKAARRWNRRLFRSTSIAGIDVEARGPESR